MASRDDVSLLHLNRGRDWLKTPSPFILRAPTFQSLALLVINQVSLGTIDKIYGGFSLKQMRLCAQSYFKISLVCLFLDEKF
jgi:hypothetical protein